MEITVLQLQVYGYSSSWRGRSIRDISELYARLQPKTTPANIANRLTEILSTEMSPLVADAIEVCLKLSIRYLWVDALCILQGSEAAARDDWARESQRMDMVFSQAYITICAAASHSCQVSFLRKYSRIKTKVPISTAAISQYRYPWLSDPQASYALSPYICGRLSDCLRGPFGWDYLYSPWWSRGWVHQEVELSERLLIFGDNLVHFRCSKLQACDNKYMQIEPPTQPSTDQDFAFSTRISPLMSLEYQNDTERRLTLFRLFRNSIKSYSAKKLTYPNDALPGVAGLARKVHELTGSSYHAGLWSESMHLDLIFIVGPDRGNLKKKGYVAPSWSWASSGRRVLYYPRAEQSEVVLMEAQTTLKGENIFGEVESGILRLRTRMLPSSTALEKGVVDDRLRVVFQQDGKYFGKVYFDRKEDAQSCTCSSNPGGNHLAWVLISSYYGNASGLVVQRLGTSRFYHRVGLFESSICFVGQEQRGGTLMARDWPTETIEVV